MGKPCASHPSSDKEKIYEIPSEHECGRPHSRIHHDKKRSRSSSSSPQRKKKKSYSHRHHGNQSNKSNRSTKRSLKNTKHHINSLDFHVEKHTTNTGQGAMDSNSTAACVNEGKALFTLSQCACSLNMRLYILCKEVYLL